MLDFEEVSSLSLLLDFEEPKRMAVSGFEDDESTITRLADASTASGNVTSGGVEDVPVPIIEYGKEREMCWAKK